MAHLKESYPLPSTPRVWRTSHGQSFGPGRQREVLAIPRDINIFASLLYLVCVLACKDFLT